MRTLLFVSFIVVSTASFAQDIYSGLDTITSWKELSECRPCYFRDGMGEGVMYGDCAVGTYTVYNEDGSWVVQHYKENTTGRWDSLWLRGYCSMPHGQWVYLSGLGDTLYSEFWDNGAFIRQVPEQSFNEYWGFDVFLGSKKLNISWQTARITDTLMPEEVSQLKIFPRLKNSSGIDLKLTCTMQVLAVGKQYQEQTFPLNEFHRVNMREMLKQANITPTDNPEVQLRILDNGTDIGGYWLTVDY